MEVMVTIKIDEGQTIQLTMEKLRELKKVLEQIDREQQGITFVPYERYIPYNPYPWTPQITWKTYMGSGGTEEVTLLTSGGA